MKKLFLLFTVGLAVVTSCKNNDDDNQPQNLLVGTWKVVKTVTISGKDNSVISTENTSGCGGSNTFQFTEDNKFIFKYYISTTGSSNCKLDETETGNYSYNSTTKNLSFTYSNNSTDNLEVFSLSNNELVTVEGLSSDYNNDGIKDKELTYLNK